MKSDAEIRDAHHRVMAVFRKRPEAALSTKRSEASLSRGLTCTVTEGDRQVVMDMPEPVGGSGEGPPPGFHARAAVSGCVAIGIKMTAARLGVALEAVNVAVEMDFDDSALLGMGTSGAAPLRTRIHIRLTSAADEDSLKSLVDTALAADPYYLALRDPQSVETRIEVE